MRNLSIEKLSASIKLTMETYYIGDKDVRPWGYYVVTDIGITANNEEYCEKIIIIKSGRALSLQSHNQRRETWTVKKGILTALLDGKRLEILPYESVYIPTGSIHCMANLGNDDCIIEERQEGICYEKDINRYMDAYNRNIVEFISPEAIESFTAYIAILDEIKNIQVKIA